MSRDSLREAAHGGNCGFTVGGGAGAHFTERRARRALNSRLLTGPPVATVRTSSSTMRREHIFQLLMAVALVLCVAGWFSARSKLRDAQAGLAAGQQELERSLAEAKRLQQVNAPRATNSPVLSDAEVLELARLRNEVTRLRNEQTASAKLATVSAAPAGTLEQAAATKVISHGVTSSANIHLGHTISLGAWRSSTPGKQIMGFLTPEISGDGVLVATRIFEMPKSLLEQLGFNQFGNGATFTPDQFKGILQRAEQAEGTDVLAMPRIITLSGREAQVAIRQRLADGTETGPLIRVTPTVDATRTAVRLDFKFELNQLPPSPPAP